LTIIINFLLDGLTVSCLFEFDIGVNSMHEPQALRLIHLKGMEPPAQIGLGAHLNFDPCVPSERADQCMSGNFQAGQWVDASHDIFQECGASAKSGAIQGRSWRARSRVRHKAVADNRLK
jgi:hypothetical protein